MPEDIWKKNPNESFTNKCQKHVACSYGYKWVCFDDKFSKPFKSYLGKEICLPFYWQYDWRKKILQCCDEKTF